MNLLRKLHLIIGFTLAVPLLIQAVTGFLLGTGIFTSLTYGLHTWSLVWRYIVFVLTPGFVFLAVSGGILYLAMRIRQWKRWLSERKSVRDSRTTQAGNGTS